ncbi:MacS family sensor histidine kinase [Streptomyces bohaiensis]|uniref:MacS family sensor histidine kinase n=1 Tax=Streptomyces bohaiensis TaxID=1431344 RepID=UPI003B829596
MPEQAEQPAISVERPLWRALTGYRVITTGYAVALLALAWGHYTDGGRPAVAAGYVAVLVVWTALTLRRTLTAERCTPAFLAGDLTVAVAGILLSPVADPAGAVTPTLPSIWVAGSVLAFAVKAGWRWAAVASAVIGAANLATAGFGRATVHNVLLVWVASIAIGYVVEVARASERALARALRIEAATRERERLARDIHDGVLQVLTMVRRRADAADPAAVELGRLAAEQEQALRRLIHGGPPPDGEPPPGGRAAPRLPSPRAGAGGTESAAGETDLRALLARRESARVTLSAPAGRVPLSAAAAREVDAAVGAALDNVWHHAGGPDGTGGRAWILLEDEPDAVVVTVRDDGPGIAPGRLAAAEAEGRMGVSLSIRGRLRDLGGTATWESVAGQGTEVELKVPKR